MKNKILSQISTECPWRDTLYWYDTIDSTNNRAKELAKEGAVHGTVVIAGSQTGGRGRMGRTFLSPIGGVYLSVILRPDCTPEKIMHLTCAVAVAGCEAVEGACGVSPGIKWTNDLVFEKKKVGGILTELILGTNGTVEAAIIGIGINCQMPTAFPQELQDTVTAIEEFTSVPCSVATVSARLIEALWDMDKALLTNKVNIMAHYRQYCITLGREIKIIQGDSTSYGKALDLDENGGLLVRFSDGSERIVASGEVSVRGMYGYL